LKEKHNLEKLKDLEDMIHDLTIELQTVKVSKNKELETEKSNRARQLAMLDLAENRKNQATGRFSIAL
jgi:hypothetical protein